MAGYGVNAALRFTLLAFLIEVVARPQDPRFARKALGPRNLVVIGGLSLALPAWYAWSAWRRRRISDGSTRAEPYPVWLDNLYLSIFWLDAVGNHFDLYDRYRRFDLIPHAHGTGAATVVVERVTGLPALSAIGVVQVLHILLEGQEYYSDVVFGLRNVRGAWDVIDDLLAGVAGSVAYAALGRAISPDRRRPRTWRSGVPDRPARRADHAARPGTAPVRRSEDA